MDTDNVKEWNEELWCGECGDAQAHDCVSDSRYEFEANCVICGNVTDHDARERHLY